MAETSRLNGAIAVTRFGLGARPGEIDGASRDPRGWLLDQIRSEGADQPVGRFRTTVESMAEMEGYRARQKEARAEQAMPAGEDAPPGERMQAATAMRRALQGDMGEEFLARTRLGATTAAGFRERWALFWANHFTVSANSLAVAVIRGSYEREAIRPHVFGRFEHLATSAIRHPAMLMYLDQTASVGPSTRAGQAYKRGLNENLAREVLELHTVGVDAGYSQADVTELARALTGWSVGRRAARGEPLGEFYFRGALHEPGERKVLGRAYPDGGQEQGMAVLGDLANDARTRRHLCRKLAAHFVADTPPPGLAAKLEAAWERSSGDLAEVARTLVEAPEAWGPAPAKFKTPYEFVVSSYRAAAAEPRAFRDVSVLMTSLDQKPFNPPSPKGWPDQAVAWASSDAVLKRLSFAERFAAMHAPAGGKPGDVARALLGERIGARSLQAVERAGSREEAFTLLLMSPEFQRR